MLQKEFDTLVEGLVSLRDQTKLTEPFNQIINLMRKLFTNYRNYRTLFDTGTIIAREMDIDTLLRTAMDKMIEVTNAERGMIILINEKGEHIFEVARNINKEEIESPEFQVSKRLIDDMLAAQEFFYVPDIREHPRYRHQKSARVLGLRAVMCVPLRHKDKKLGVIYVDNRSIGNIFDVASVEFLKCFADQIAIAVENALEQRKLREQNRKLADDLRRNYQFGEFVGNHPKVVEIMNLVAQIADTDATVLIEGESGTGKELIARALHFNSSRKQKKMLAINCGALPETLLESELFGHLRGAFTGATTDKKGKFEIADGGTIFLDEIAEMSPMLQVKLLRILQTGEYSPVGCADVRKCDVRIIAASNKDLKKLVKDSKFRDDLYYRLNIIRLQLPPLRERRSDIMFLAKHFLDFYSRQFGKHNLEFSKATERFLLNYDYPGNVRELENIVQRAVLLTKSNLIGIDLLSEDI
ncbi:sigma-54-dependent Fis family transcriptional regulator, partial [candidate division KSB1 bacterium]|nr:sigma-54-dependent Fis family transcriptional regulator [candidate division KSB1 bacterium]